MPRERVVVVGAGVAGLAAAVDLAAAGCEVVVVEKAAAPGGKLREVRVGDHLVDGGPTVLTMRWVFDELFDEAGASFDRSLELTRAHIIARHAWSEDERLDLFADVAESADAIGRLAGPREARGYERFCADAKGIFETLDHSFIRQPRPSLPGLVRAVGLRRLGALRRIRPFTTFWKALEGYFQDARLRQLFGRYATYVGSSPFLSPATLMLVAHVEQVGVWILEAGMHGLARALAELAGSLGASFRYGESVAEIESAGGRTSGVLLESGERLEAAAVVCNADVAALAGGRFGETVARSFPAPSRSARSQSAVTWSVVARSTGFPLVRHNVFFGGNYRDEFEDVFVRQRIPADPTVYVCAQDRPGHDGSGALDEERLFCLVNAPPTGDAHSFEPREIEPCEERAFGQLARCGLELERTRESTVVTTPTDFERLFPGTGGALYGPPSHGWQASFRRPGVRGPLPGLYLAGGSAHPGPGVPMVALSGRMAAAALREDLASTSRSRTVGTGGGMRTR